MRGGRFPVAPRPPATVTDSSTEAVVAAAEQFPGSNTVATQHTSDPLLLLSPVSEGDGHTLMPPEAGDRAFPPHIGDNLVIGTHVMEGSPSAMGMPGASVVEAVEDANAALGPDLAYVVDGELGDGGIGIHDNVENTFVENTAIAEGVVDRPPIELEEGACR